MSKTLFNHYLDLANQDNNLSRAERDIYKLLLNLKWHNQRKLKNDNVKIAFSVIACEANTSLRTAKYAVQKMLEQGYLKRVKQGGLDGMQSNVYKVVEFPNLDFYNQNKNNIKVKENTDLEVHVKMGIRALIKKGHDGHHLHATDKYLNAKIKYEKMGTLAKLQFKNKLEKLAGEAGITI